MKKFITLIISLILIISLAACGSDDAGTVYEGNAAKKDNMFVDLTKLSSTMVYSEVSHMMSKPESYVGKTVKMSGEFTLYYNQKDESKTYYACIVKDATACCSQGLEFVLKDGFEYPQLETEITVQGVFELYDEDNTTYCRIANAELL